MAELGFDIKGLGRNETQVGVGSRLRSRVVMLALPVSLLVLVITALLVARWSI
ncbi:MAG: hypothetical protein ACE5OY_08680 [Candidatus Bathyarchaeia archaeon]